VERSGRGGFYELALEYKRGVAGGLVNGVRRLWHLEGLDDCDLDPAWTTVISVLIEVRVA
jgi:hypothetical protein